MHMVELEVVQKQTTVEKIATSKINWTQYVAFIASLAVLFGFDLDQETQINLVAFIQAAQSLLTWVLRTFFNHPPA